MTKTMNLFILLFGLTFMWSCHHFPKSSCHGKRQNVEKSCSKCSAGKCDKNCKKKDCKTDGECNKDSCKKYKKKACSKCKAGTCNKESCKNSKDKKCSKDSCKTHRKDCSKDSCKGKWYKKKSCSKNKNRKCGKDSCKTHRKDCSKDSCKNKHSKAGLAFIKGWDKNNSPAGSVAFTKAGKNKVKIIAGISGLKPNQKFGFHVHEFGVCEEKGLMAGAHLNPYSQKHGSHKSGKRHLGDLGNLKSNSKGYAEYSKTIEGHIKHFLGRSVIIHEGRDDLKSQPTGNSGSRIACGIIGVNLPPAPPKKPEEKPVEKPAEKVKNETAVPEKTTKEENKTASETKTN